MRFCRHRAQCENENASFWIEEVKDWDDLIAQYIAPVVCVYEGTANDRSESRQSARAWQQHKPISEIA